jgi:hypothetical protein
MRTKLFQHIPSNKEAEGDFTFYRVDRCLRFGVREVTVPLKQISVSEKGFLTWWHEDKTSGRLRYSGIKCIIDSEGWSPDKDEAFRMAQAEKEKQLRYAKSRAERIERVDFVNGIYLTKE